MIGRERESLHMKNKHIFIANDNKLMEKMNDTKTLTANDKVSARDTKKPHKLNNMWRLTIQTFSKIYFSFLNFFFNYLLIK